MSTQRRTRRLSSAALVLGLGAALLLGPLAPPAAAAANPQPSLDATFSSLLNSLRSTLGLGALTVDPTLSDVARRWSTNMASSNRMYHNPSLTSQVSGWQKLGENVGYGGAVTQIFNALVASPPHMKNMSDREFTRIGVGTVKDATGTVWTTHVFMRPRDGAPAAAPIPAAPAPAPRATAPAPTQAPRPVPTTAAPTTALPTTAAPTTVPPQTTVAPVAEDVTAAGAHTAAEAPAPTVPGDPPATSSSQPGPPTPLLAGAAMLGLLVLGGAGLLLRGSTGARRWGRRPARAPEDLGLALDLPGP